MMSKCLYCYNEVVNGNDFHEKCLLSFFNTREVPRIPYAFNQMTDLAKDVVERSVAVPGVQPKLSMSLINKTKEDVDTRLTIVGALGGDFIFKPPSEEYEQMPENEHVTMRMAELFGIRVVPSSLIRLKSGELSYITKRVDRNPDGSKIHMIDMFQATEAFDKYKGSMEKVGKAIGEYSANPLLDKLFYFELVLFCFLTGNNDMHLKNFSMIETASGYGLAPAYDLLNVSILLPEDDEEFALTLQGKKKKMKTSYFKTFAEGLGLTNKQVDGVYKRIKAKFPQGLRLLESSFLNSGQQDKYKSLLQNRFQRLFEGF